MNLITVHKDMIEITPLGLYLFSYSSVILQKHADDLIQISENRTHCSVSKQMHNSVFFAITLEKTLLILNCLHG